jgi:hypothetical protein
VFVLTEVPDTVTPTATPRSGIDRVERIGKLRDGILVASGALYVLGYGVWSVHALGEGLGLLPALELQYLLAGSLLALILLSSLLLGVALMRVAYGSQNWKQSPHAFVRLLGSVLPGLLGGGVAALAITLMSFAGHFLLGSLLCVVGGGLLALLSSVGPMRRYERGSVAVFLVSLVALSSTVLFLTVIYPKVPQAVGGVEPQCGYLEVARADASAVLVQELFDPAQTETDTIARSRKLSILFSGGDTYVVRVRNLDNARTYEVRKEIIKSASSC